MEVIPRKAAGAMFHPLGALDAEEVKDEHDIHATTRLPVYLPFSSTD